MLRLILWLLSQTPTSSSGHSGGEGGLLKLSWPLPVLRHLSLPLSEPHYPDLLCPRLETVRATLQIDMFLELGQVPQRRSWPRGWSPSTRTFLWLSYV